MVALEGWVMDTKIAVFCAAIYQPAKLQKSEPNEVGELCKSIIIRRKTIGFQHDVLGSLIIIIRRKTLGFQYYMLGSLIIKNSPF